MRPMSWFMADVCAAWAAGANAAAPSNRDMLPACLDGAIAEATAAVAMAPADAGAFNHRAAAHLNKGDRARAETDIETPGLDVDRLFRRVRDAIARKTGGCQEPFVNGSLPDADMSFRPR